MKRYILQYIANQLIMSISVMPEGPMRDYMCGFGAQLNAYAIVFHDIYLA